MLQGDGPAEKAKPAMSMSRADELELLYGQNADGSYAAEGGGETSKTYGSECEYISQNCFVGMFLI